MSVKLSKETPTPIGDGVVTPTTEYMVVGVGWHYSLALPVSRALEIITIAPEQICPLPMVHPALLGVMGWRGQLLWTIALDRWIGLSSTLGQTMPTSDRPGLVLGDPTLDRHLICVVEKLYGIEQLNLDHLAPVPSELAQHPSVPFQGYLPSTQLLILQDNQLFQPTQWPSKMS